MALTALSVAIFPSIKSPVQSNTFLKFLREIIASGVNGVAKPAAEVDKFVAALGNPLNVEVTPADANQNKTIRMSAVGTAAVTAAESAPAPAKVAKTPLTFTLDDGFVPPTPNRVGTRTSIYPFDTMGVGQSFFIPSTADTPDPAKSLASTVSAATRRYGTEKKDPTTGAVVMKAGRKPGSQIPVLEYSRVFTIRSIAGTEPNETGKGARVYRTQ